MHESLLRQAHHEEQASPVVPPLGRISPLPAKHDPVITRNMIKIIKIIYTMLCAPRQLSTLQQPACMGVFKQLNTYQNALAIQVGTICNRDTFVEFGVNNVSSRAVTASGA